MKWDDNPQVSEEVDWADKQMVWDYMDRKHLENNKSEHGGDHSKYVHTNKEMLRGHNVGKLFWETSMTG